MFRSTAHNTVLDRLPASPWSPARLEHLETVTAEQATALARSGVVASVRSTTCPQWRSDRCAMLTGDTWLPTAP